MKCFALAQKGDKQYCTILNKKNCKNCAFFNTDLGLAISQKKALRRFSSLDNASRSYFISKYKMEVK